MRWLCGTLVTLLTLFGLVGPVGAAPAQAAEPDIADEIDATGRYVEFDLTGAEEAAVDKANDDGVAFVWLNSDQDPEPLAQSLSRSLDDLGSRYRTVLVLSDSGVAAWSETVADDTIEDGLDASFDQFATGAVAEGLDSFSSTLGQPVESGSSPTTPSGSSDSSGGGNVGKILLVGLLGGGGFFLFRSLRKRSKAKKQAAAEMETDRAEIKEQLRDNADHVLELGDRVIKSDQGELIATYEQASSAYQHVSQSIDQATSAAEIDALDDKIDHAEWQFESIEAQLEGRPVPPSPAEVQAQAEAAASSRADRPALGPNESVLPGGSAPTRSQPRYQPQRRGGGLGGVLGSIILGSGGLGGGRSRRSQRRTPSYQGRGGGLGGGVLGRGPSSRRRSSSSRRRSSSSSRRRSGGGSRSFERRGGGGSRRF